AALEHRYVALVGWMVGRPRAMLCIFVALVGAAAAVFAIYPTTLMPLEDQGYAIGVAGPAPGGSQPRVRDVAAKIDRLLGSTSGIKGWVTIGGYSALDSAKLSTAVTSFVMYEDFDKRPKDFSQLKLLAELQAKTKDEPTATFAVLPPSPIPGLGNAFGFQMMLEDRGGTGLRELDKAAHAMLTRARDDPGFLRVGFTTFDAASPQLFLDIDRPMARALGVTVDDVFKTLQAYLGSSTVNFFNQFNQSFQVRVQADADSRRRLADLSRFTVANRSGQMIPLGALV